MLSTAPHLQRYPTQRHQSGLGQKKKPKRRPQLRPWTLKKYMNQECFPLTLFQIEQLSEDVLGEIFRRLDLQSLIAASQVCRVWSDVTWTCQVDFKATPPWNREWKIGQSRGLIAWKGLRKCVRLQELNLQRTFELDRSQSRTVWPYRVNPESSSSTNGVYSSSRVDLSVLAGLTRLTSLNLSDNTGLGDPHLNAIQSLTLLTKLDLSDSSSYNMVFPCTVKMLGSSLACLTQLKDLRLAGLTVDEPLFSVSGFCKNVLCKLPKLEMVSLFNTIATDWVELTALQHLNKVAITGWAATSIQPSEGSSDRFDSLSGISETLAQVKFGVLLLNRHNVPETLVGRAAARGSLESLSWMLDLKDKIRSYDPNLSDFSGFTPLMGVDNEEAAILLLKAGAEINAVSGPDTDREQSFPFTTALMQAVWDKKFFLTRLLLKSGADIFRGSILPLKIAALKDYREIFDEILQFYPDALRKHQSFTDNVLQAIHGSRQLSCLLSCLNESPIEWSREFIRSYRDNLKGLTMLHRAIMTRAPLPVIQKLVEIGADINDPNASGNSALRLACSWGDADTVKVLLKGGPLTPEMNFAKYPSCMSICIIRGMKRVYLESLRSYTPAQLTMGPVPIIYDVARSCSWAEFALFMLHGASNTTVYDNEYSQVTPDYIAEHSVLDLKSNPSPTHSALVGALLRAKADDETIKILTTILQCGSPTDSLSDNFGCPALMLAMRYGPVAVKLLLDAGCSAEIPASSISINVEKVDDYNDYDIDDASKFQEKLPGHNPVTLAASLLDLPSLALLLQHGANISHAKSSTSGKSALHCCLSLQLHVDHAFLPPKDQAKTQLAPITAFLLQNGLDPDDACTSGLTAFGYAMQQYNTDPKVGSELLKLLFQHSKAPRLFSSNYLPKGTLREKKRALRILSPLEAMIEGGFDLALIQRVLEQTPQLARLPTRDGRLPITIAGQFGAHEGAKTNLTRLLLEHGASACRLDKFGVSGISVAISRGNFELMKMMIQFYQTQPRPGFHDSVEIVNAPVSKTGLNALGFAAQEGQSRAIPILISLGFASNPVFTPEQQHGCSPLELAVIYDRVESVRVLLENNANVNTLYRGKNILQRAIYYAADAAILKMLVDAGADQTQFDEAELEKLKSIINM